MATLTKRERRRAASSAPGEGSERRRRAFEPERLFDDRAATSGFARPVLDAERRRRLEEVVLTTWAALAAGHPVECPVCGGPLTAASGCTRCGSRLS